MREHYEQLRAVLDMLVTAYPALILPQHVDWDSFLWAVQLWYSYSVQVRSIPPPLFPAPLLPAASVPQRPIPHSAPIPAPFSQRPYLSAPHSAPHSTPISQLTLPPSPPIQKEGVI